jgi:hypothetical protein
MRGTAGYTSVIHKRNLDIMKELLIQASIEFIENYTADWNNHVLRMSRSRITSF